MAGLCCRISGLSPDKQLESKQGMDANVRKQAWPDQRLATGAHIAGFRCSFPG